MSTTVEQTQQNQGFGTLNSGILTASQTLTAGGVLLPSTGGTSTVLNDYEEYVDTNYVFTSGSGYTVGSKAVTIRIVRIGKKVTAFIAPITFTGNGGAGATFNGAATIPQRFNVAFQVFSQGQPGASGVPASITLLHFNSNSFQIGAFFTFSNFGATLGLDYGCSTGHHMTWTLN